jgi:hypothetical protein
VETKQDWEHGQKQKQDQRWGMKHEDLELSLKQDREQETKHEDLELSSKQVLAS